MRFSFVSFILTLLSLFATLSAAAPVLEKRDVFVPPIIEPSAGSVWKKGTVQTVQWDVSHPPAQITNTKGRIVLRDVQQEILLLNVPLAQGFDIMDGTRQVQVPTTVPAGSYQIVVFGNSGNWGPIFKIVD